MSGDVSVVANSRDLESLDALGAGLTGELTSYVNYKTA